MTLFKRLFNLFKRKERVIATRYKSVNRASIENEIHQKLKQELGLV